MPRAMPDGPGKRYTLSSRLTFETHTALKEAASRSGRSISQEAEFRLERSLAEDSEGKSQTRDNLVAKALIGDDDTEDMIRCVTAAIGAAMAYTNKHWRDDIYTRAAVQAAMGAVRSKHFSIRPLDMDPESVSLERLERAISTGALLGKVLVAAKLDPDVASWIEGMGKEAQSQADQDADVAAFAKLTPARQNAAVKSLMGVDAA